MPTLADAPAASLLAAQPPTPLDKLPQLQAGWGDFYEKLESRLNSLRTWRYSWWAFWGVLAAFFIPRRYIWLVVANRMWRGSALNDQIINSTGVLAVRTCAAGMWTGLTSPSRPWFKQGVMGVQSTDLDEDGREWLEDSDHRMYTVLAGSNFYSQMAQVFQDEVVFGTAPLITYEDFEDVVRFYLPCAGEYYLANGARLNNDSFYREFTYTTAQIVGRWTLEKCPPAVQTAWDTKGASLDQEFVIAHAIEPNTSLLVEGKVKWLAPRLFPWREVYWLRGQKENPLEVKGFHSEPFAVFRAYLCANDAYGRSFCMDAIGDNKQIQLQDRRKAEYITKGVRPSMGADVELKNNPYSTIPDGVTFVSTEGGKKGFFPLYEINPQWLPGLTVDIQQVAARVEKALFVDLFMAISRMEGVQPRNELELTKRDLERLQELGPVITLAEEALSKILTRVRDIMERRGLLKPRPASLRGAALDIKYHSILRLAQRAAQSVAMKDTFQTAGALSSAAKAAGVPDPIRVLDLDKAMREYGDINNFPADCIFTDDEVRAHDKIRQQEMQKAQMPQQASAAVQAAKTLSETSLPGGNSALGAMLGQQ